MLNLSIRWHSLETMTALVTIVHYLRCGRNCRSLAHRDGYELWPRRGLDLLNGVAARGGDYLHLRLGTAGGYGGSGCAPYGQTLLSHHRRLLLQEQSATGGCGLLDRRQ